MAWSSVLEAAESSAHVVQFYGTDDRFYFHNVCRYLAEGLTRREGLVVVATPAHAQAFALHLTGTGPSGALALREGRLAFLDAHRSLAEIMAGPDPDRDRFDAVIGGALRRVAARSDHRRVRAYGEMVGLLWGSGQVAAAVKLEECWNRLLLRERCSVFCGYPIEVVGSGFRQVEVDAVLGTHTHFIPADREFREAIDAAVGDVLGPIADGVRLHFNSSFRSGETMPPVEAIALWLQRNLPDQADAILARVRAYAVGGQALAAVPAHEAIGPMITDRFAPLADIARE